MYSRRLLLNLTNKRNILCLHLIKQQRYLQTYHVEKTQFLNSLVLINSLRYSSDSPLKCWNCNFLYKSNLFCGKCKVLQKPPENLTYFDLMGIPQDFNVSVSEIHNKYRELQKLLHPDKFSNKSEKEKELSESLSSLVNKAYSTLANPLQRGLYMLELNGILIREDTDNVNSEFLMEIMERNEEIEDAADDAGRIVELLKENEEMLDSLSKKVADAFHQKEFHEAEAIIIRMKYYDSINNRLKKMKHDRGIVD